jgi:hypothetical protein
LLRDLDDFDRDPMILNPPDFCQTDVYTCGLIVQPETNFNKVAWNQQVGRRNLCPGFIEREYTPVGFELLVHSCQHAVNCQIWSRPTGLLFP